ncbi:hypothetical protein [Tuwongella immobilis]|uniref:Uncharacterized protein n=1 Tax=Tuwongella immobilis TaxID=692036 RepID=A0A6C2YSR6_9BACT|nr:hypothetical protein [Tuwongella immobilis]VIP04768.1 Uncharacterized protein OS=Pseudoalteromonas citrea GN=DC53_18360 PE=4 SV=1 [Tuwongella immobilis]VTS06895.1 Uncharacterized protein OS=Pseudoalteromonas citrea GN=DC53_18360 PE=4 SV=1 [Tuwongella immobilis]
MFQWLRNGKRSQSKEYLIDGRLEDVIALIQVLGLDEHTHRGESALLGSLKGPPSSAEKWATVARQHPEFFRIHDGRGGESIALIARHFRPDGEDGPALTMHNVNGLIESAIQIHHGQLQRRQILRATRFLLLGSLIVAALPKVLDLIFAR